MAFRTLDDVDPAGRRVLVRVDFNAPMRDGAIADSARLEAAAPTIERLRRAGARTVLISHFGRPEGRPVPEMSLQPIAAPLRALLGAEIGFAKDCIGETARIAVEALPAGGVLLLENLRFHPGEEADSADFARALGANGDLFVQDAFSVCHRAHASTDRLPRLMPAFAGEAMRRELDALRMALEAPQRPVLGVVGGSKVSTKLDLLRHLVERLDHLAIGGGMANTFLAAQGWPVGASLLEPDLIDTAREVASAAERRGCGLLLPLDVVVAADGGAGQTRALDEVGNDERILDAGPKTIARLLEAMKAARTLVWNGPLGIFEKPPFDAGTTAAARAAAALARSGQLVAVAGGGDTVAALKHARAAPDFTYVSNAGGAFLEWMEGRVLPGVAALQVEQPTAKL